MSFLWSDLTITDTDQLQRCYVFDCFNIVDRSLPASFTVHSGLEQLVTAAGY